MMAASCAGWIKICRNEHANNMDFLLTMRMKFSEWKMLRETCLHCGKHVLALMILAVLINGYHDWNRLAVYWSLLDLCALNKFWGLMDRKLPESSVDNHSLSPCFQFILKRDMKFSSKIMNYGMIYLDWWKEKTQSKNILLSSDHLDSKER